MIWSGACGPAAWWRRSAPPARRPSIRSRRWPRSAQRHGLWLHVDAALAGNAAILPEKRWLLDGCDRCDSLVFNPAQVAVHELRLLGLLHPRCRTR